VVKAVRRLGRSPAELGNTTGVTGSPDILELDDGSFAVIGVDVTEEIGAAPLSDARCAPNERIVRIPRSTLTAAKSDIPEA
jgi:hypothetical protein